MPTFQLKTLSRDRGFPVRVSRCVIHKLAIPILVIGSTPKSKPFSAEVPDDGNMYSMVHIHIIVLVSVSRFITLQLLFKPHVKHSPYSRMFSSSMSPSKALTVVLGSKLLFELTWLIAS